MFSYTVMWGVQGVVLEDHGDVPVLGATSFIRRSPMYRSPPEISSRPATIRRVVDLSAAGGADQDDKFLVRNFQVEIMDGHYAFRCHGEVGLVFLDRLVMILLLFLFLGLIAR